MVAVVIVVAAIVIVKNRSGGGGDTQAREHFENPVYADTTPAGAGYDGMEVGDPGESYTDVPMAETENPLYDDDGYMDTHPQEDF